VIRELLLPLLAIVILVNAGVIAFAIGSRRARGSAPPRRRPTASPAAFGRAVAWSPPPVRPQAAIRPASTPPLVRPLQPAGAPSGSWEELLRRDAAGPTPAPAAILAVELVGLDRLRARLGRDTAHRLVITTGVALRHATRPGDHIGWDGAGQFRILLAGADEAIARACVDRLTGVVGPTLEGQRPAVELAVGWGVRIPGGDLRDAVRQAERQIAPTSSLVEGAAQK
jgi:GGDEF domain-containing protein